MDLSQFVHCKYGRDDVNYEHWHTAGMKRIALSMPPEEIVARLSGNEKNLKQVTTSHLNAIRRTSSMQSQSQARAQSRNVVEMVASEKAALLGALEIYHLFPEHTKMVVVQQKREG